MCDHVYTLAKKYLYIYNYLFTIILLFTTYTIRILQCEPGGNTLLVAEEGSWQGKENSFQTQKVKPWQDFS